MTHDTAYYSDEARVKTIYCKKCAKEGLRLSLEPNCPGKFVAEKVDKEKQSD